MQGESERIKRTDRIIGGILTTIVSVCCFYLFYRQSLVPADITGLGNAYFSDLPFHIKNALTGEKAYSIYYYILRFLNRSSKYPDAIATALFLTSVVSATIWMNQRLIADYSENIRFVNILAVLALFVASISIPVIYPYFYDGQLDTQPWHNGSYLMMRLFCIPLMVVYFRIKDTYKDKINKRDLFLFVLLSSLCCWSKPSFIMVLYPVMFIGLLLDMKNTEKSNIKRKLVFGLCVLPSLAVVAYQYFLSFPGGTGVAGTVSGDVEDVSGILVGITDPIGVILLFSFFKLLFGLAFPLYVLWSGQGKILKKTPVRTAYAMYFVAYLEMLLLHETGKRSGDGNFGWGMFAAAYFLVMYSLCEFFSDFQQREKWDKVAGVLLLLWHCGGGVIYFACILLGESGPASI